MYLYTCTCSLHVRVASIFSHTSECIISIKYNVYNFNIYILFEWHCQEGVINLLYLTASTWNKCKKKIAVEKIENWL